MVTDAERRRVDHVTNVKVPPLSLLPPLHLLCLHTRLYLARPARRAASSSILTPPVTQCPPTTSTLTDEPEGIAKAPDPPDLPGRGKGIFSRTRTQQRPPGRSVRGRCRSTAPLRRAADGCASV